MVNQHSSLDKTVVDNLVEVRGLVTSGDQASKTYTDGKVDEIRTQFTDTLGQL